MRRIIQRFLDRVCGLVQAYRPRRIVDLGCGEGIVARELVDRLGGGFEYLGLDLSEGSIEVARRLNHGLSNLSFEAADILEREPVAGWADLVLCLEVLEHLPEPERALARIGEWSSHRAIVSVPWEPWFRLGNLARGRHPARLGNHPEHLHQFRARSFHALLERSGKFATVQVETCFPWLIGEMRVEYAGPGAGAGAQRDG